MRHFRFFQPILAGATARDRALACLGAAIGISLIAISGKIIDGPVDIEAWIFAPVGASAVLVFAVPASPLTQPWPVIGGLFISAAAGIAVGLLIGDDVLAAGIAVGVAIGLMSVTRTLHPPGGAAAITAVVGVHVGNSAEVLYPLLLVTVDGVAVVLLGWAFHRLVSGHSYPHVTPLARAMPNRNLPGMVSFSPEDVDSVLARIDDSFDIGKEDLEAILRAVEIEALSRSSR